MNYIVFIQRRIIVALILLTGLSRTGEAQQTAPAAYPGSGNVNYVRTWDAVKPDTTNANFTMSSGLQHSRITTQYVDGLGRPIQTVAKQGSLVTGSTANDLVSPVVYDEFGREMYKYLPFAANSTGSNSHITDGLFKMNPFQEDSTFNKGMFSDESWYYSQTNYEASPLNRVLESYAPGNNWVGTSGQSTESNRHAVKMKYWINTTTDSVRIWNVTDVSNDFGTYASSAMYAAGTLFKNATLDENNNEVIEFKDKEGKVILKKVQLTAVADTGTGKGPTGWLNTYYIYDDLNNLRCVIQPRGVELLLANSWSFTSTILAEQCFRYEYDYRNRMIMKKVPGAGTVYMVYDARDRLVMTQDSLMRSNHQWLYTQYDVLNRPVATGLLSDGSYYNNPAHHWSIADTTVNYPTAGSYTVDTLTKTFYDDYTWRAGQSNPLSDTRSTSYDSYLQSASNTTWPYPQSATSQSNATRGMVTGTKVKVLGTSSTYLYSVSFYDSRARVIQVQSQNISTGTDIAVTQYSFAGQALFTITKNEKAGTNSQTSIVLTQMTYDSLMRVVKIEKKTSNTKVSSGSMPGSWTTEVQNEYEALGQLKKKKLSSAPLETLNYDYNIRGWLLGANRNYIKNTDAGGYEQHYFGFELGYDKASNSTGADFYHTLQYNGNITGMIWKSTGDAVRRKYDFRYDAVNRLGTADYRQNISEGSGGSFLNTDMDYTVCGDQSANDWYIRYDANGNILAMIQRGWKLGAPTSPIDQLAYTYYTNSNKLLNVIDNVNDTTTKLGDFRSSTAYMNSLSNNKTSSATDYTYDGNGNLTEDNNKDISLIHYNYLSLPDSIVVTSKGHIVYTYDAAGNKLKKVTTEGSTVTSTLYLFGNFVNDTLQFLPTEEGRVRFNTADNSLSYDYFIKDHLGNVRMVLTEQKDTAFYPAVTFEDANTTNEQIYYENAGDQRTARPGSFFTSGTNGDKVQLLRKSTQSVGAGKLLKVMAGDRLHIRVDYYVENTTTDNGSANGQSAILTVLGSLINNSPITTNFHGGGSTVTSNLNSSTPFTSFISPENGSGGTMPKAYLNILFFDEQFNFVSTNSEIIQVDTKGSGQTITRISSNAKEAAKNGYAYIFVSNESNNLVYFDNFQVTHERGPLTEDNSYYPFGLTMAGISDKALNFGNPENRKKFNGIEYTMEFDLNTYDALFRTLDPQIGRWWTIDPKPNEFESPYAAMGNNPILRADPLGDTAIYYNSAGKEIYRIKDGSKTITPSIVSDKKMEAFNEAIKDGATVKDLKGLGTTYDTKAFSKFFADNGKKFKANYVGSASLEGAKSVKVNGKAVDPNNLKAEATANLVLKDGTVTVGTNPATTNNSMTGADPDKPGNEPGKVGNIHTHPTAGEMSVQIDKIATTVVDIHGGAPSQGDYSEYGRSGNGSVRFVIVDQKYIYLYNGNADQTIKIPRQ